MFSKLKGIIITAIILLTIIVFNVSCSLFTPRADRPEPVQGADKDLGKTFQYEVAECWYYQQFSKIDLRCSDKLKENSKVLLLYRYQQLKKTNALPDIYTKNSAAKMTFGEFHRYVK